MADSDVQITAGSGTKVDTRTVGAGTDEHRQVVVIGSPSAAVDVAPVDVALGLKVNAGGNVASGAADSGNPVKVGGVYNASRPSLSDGQRVDAQADSSGNHAVGVFHASNQAFVNPTAHALRTILYGGTGSVSEVTATGVDASDNVFFALNAQGHLMGFNGTSWDRLRSDITNGLDVDVTRLPALAAGTNNIGDVDVLTLPGSLTGKANDAAAGLSDVGLPILGVRNDTPTIRNDTDGDYTQVSLDAYGRVQTAPVRSLPKSIQVSGSIGIQTAATWQDKAVWVVPANNLFAPKMARSGVTTAGTRTLVLAGKQLATFNPNTNTFTATGSVSSPDFYDRLFYRVATTHSATANTMTATYVDQDGNSGNATGGLVIAASAAGGSWFEFILAANDFGVRSVSAVADTAAPTSVVDEIWGFRTLLEDLGPANTPHIAHLGEGLKIPAAESVVILFNAAATTAQQRFASVLGDLVAA